MSDLSEKARDIFQKNGWHFLLGWILGMGLGQTSLGFNRRGAVMSKNKPKETIEYVIRFQDKERQLLDSITTAYMLGDLVNAWINYRQSPTYVEEYEERATSVTGGLVNVWEQIWFAIVGGPARTFQQNEGSGGGGGF
jgi:hypothetical protein